MMKFNLRFFAFPLILALAVSAFGQEPARPIPRGAAAPPTPCVVGDLYFRTATTVGLYVCTAAPGTWTLLGSGGGGGSIGPGTVGFVPKFLTGTTIGDSLISETGTDIAVAGQLTVSQATPANPVFVAALNGGTVKFTINSQGVPTFKGFAALPTGYADGAQAGLIYYNGPGSFAGRMMINNGLFGDWGPAMRVLPTGSSTNTRVPVASTNGDYTDGTLTASPWGDAAPIVSAKGDLESINPITNNGRVSAINNIASATRLRTTSSTETTSGLVVANQSLLEIAGSTELLVKSPNDSTPIKFGFGNTVRFLFNPSGLSIIPTVVNTSGLQLGITSASPVTGATAAICVDGIGGVVRCAASGNTIAIQDEGVAQGTAGTVNFVGGNVTAAVAAGVATVTVSGGGGGGTPSAQLCTGSCTANNTNLLTACDATGASSTVTLPSAASNTGLIKGVSKADLGTNVVSITDGTNVWVINSPQTTFYFHSNGSAWILDSY